MGREIEKTGEEKKTHGMLEMEWKAFSKCEQISDSVRFGCKIYAFKWNKGIMQIEQVWRFWIMHSEVTHQNDSKQQLWSKHTWKLSLSLDEWTRMGVGRFGVSLLVSSSLRWIKFRIPNKSPWARLLLLLSLLQLRLAGTSCRSSIKGCFSFRWSHAQIELVPAQQTILLLWIAF